MCRTELPPVPEKLLVEAVRLYMVIYQKKVGRGQSPRDALAAEEQKLIDEVVEMFKAASDQGHARAQSALGSVYRNGESVLQSDVEAAQ